MPSFFMYEGCTKAVVLSRDEFGEADAKIVLFTKEFGRISAKAKSLRKITSKLSSHLQPGDLSKIRVVGKNAEGKHFQIVDAMREKKLSLSLDFLMFVKDLTYDLQPDESLWRLLSEENGDMRSALRALGWNPEHASCGACNAIPVRYFWGATQSFLCRSCISKIAQNEVIYEI